MLIVARLDWLTSTFCLPCMRNHIAFCLCPSQRGKRSGEDGGSQVYHGLHLQSVRRRSQSTGDVPSRTVCARWTHKTSGILQMLGCTCWMSWENINKFSEKSSEGKKTERFLLTGWRFARPTGGYFCRQLTDEGIFHLKKSWHNQGLCVKVFRTGMKTFVLFRAFIPVLDWILGLSSSSPQHFISPSAASYFVQPPSAIWQPPPSLQNQQMSTS